MSNDPKDIQHVVMVIETGNYLSRLEANQFNLFTQKLHNSLLKSINQFNGKILRNNDNEYIVRFVSVTNAVLCALKIQDNFKYITPKFDKSIRQLKIGIASGLHNKLNHTIDLATRLCEVVQDQVVISSDIKTKYEIENKHSRIDEEQIKTIKPKDEAFVNAIMDYTDTIWKDRNFNVNNFSKNLPYSNIQVYRKLKALTGKSPSRFLRDFRLKKALLLLHDKKGNITELAIESGFNSLTYFSKCFKSRFGILPSVYRKQH